MIVALGYSPVWWGIVFVILMEAALITPPVGLNLYVVQAVRRGGAFSDLCIGALPFVVMMLVMIGILIAFPSWRCGCRPFSKALTSQRRISCP